MGGIFKRDDPYRDSFWRIFGYGRVIAANSRSLHHLPLVTPIGSLISTVYCAADIYDKSSNKYKNPLDKSSRDYKRTFIAAGDALMWQSLASFLIPEFTIFGVRFITSSVLGAVKNKSQISSIVGLAVIPIIIKPIDQLVDSILENTYRKVF